MMSSATGGAICVIAMAAILAALIAFIRHVDRQQRRIDRRQVGAYLERNGLVPRDGVHLHVVELPPRASGRSDRARRPYLSAPADRPLARPSRVTSPKR